MLAVQSLHSLEMAMAPSPGEITRLLSALKRGNRAMESQLIDLVYNEFHARAEHYMRAERPDHTLQPTALVNEAYVRLMRGDCVDFESRAHFFATASIVMRRILVDHARTRGAAKRPNARQKVELNEFMASPSPRLDQMLILDEALTRLSHMDERQARLVEMMYFGGLTEDEAAEVLGISVRTVKRDWRDARAWLQAELNQPRT
jgi:RNA polymerase sigma-70 factor (ECF subfamily)